MRLIAWNCCQKFATNYVHLRDLDFDVAVVAECSRVSADALQQRGLTCDFVPPFPGAAKLLGVLAQEPWRVTPHLDVPSAPWLLPMQVQGPLPFTLLAFWAADPTRFGSYSSQLRRVVDEVVPALEGPVVLAGDFNAPVAGSATAHAANVRALRERGLVSAYTATREEGAELEPTYYHLRREDEPFHIDHVFVPEGWVARASLRVGTHREWVASRRSDHVPLILDVEERTVPAYVGG